MTAPLVWVVGAGGLLGSAVSSALGSDAWLPKAGFRWCDESNLLSSFRAAIAAFAQRVAVSNGRPWSVVWCAGAGVVGTCVASLDGELAAFRQFLDLLAQEPSLCAARGHVVLASSAGGVFGGALGCPITEATLPEPISAYGHAKLEQERVLLAWARARPGSVATLVARFSNLYGPAQRLDKPQGLISHLSRCVIHNAPVHVYVPLDTIRDYLFSEDAGRRLVIGLNQLVREPTARHVTKIYASEREISIAGLLGVFRQIARRRLRVVSGLSPTGALQPRRLRFRSRVWPEDMPRQVELIEGVSRVYQHQLARFGQGLLPPPRLA